MNVSDQQHDGLQSSMVFVIRFITVHMFEDDEYGFKEPFEASMRDLQALMTEFGAQRQNLGYLHSD